MNPRSYSRSELIEDLQRVADELGRAPTKTEYNERGTASSTTVRRHLGGWAAGLDAAGLEPRGHSVGGHAFNNSKYSDLVGSAVDDNGGGRA